VDGYLVRDGRRSRPAAPGQPGAQAASLEYRVETVSGKTSLLEIELLTGRRHQIRAQLAGLGHPILGDRLYGSEYDPRDDAIGLYARSLGFVHPTTKDELVFRADPPSDWPWRP
jgi:23S rRNA pseudouridine1911/1915/1917 synthase